MMIEGFKSNLRDAMFIISPAYASTCYAATLVSQRDSHFCMPPDQPLALLRSYPSVTSRVSRYELHPTRFSALANINEKEIFQSLQLASKPRPFEQPVTRGQRERLPCGCSGRKCCELACSACHNLTESSSAHSDNGSLGNRELIISNRNPRP